MAIDQAALRTLRRSNPDAPKVLNALRERKTRREVTVETLVESTGIAPRRVRAVLKRVDEAGAGRLVWGRKGGVTRFVWTEGSPEDIPGPSTGEEGLTGARGTAVTQWVVNLGPGKQGTLLVPTKFGQRDREALRKFVDAVPLTA